MDNLTWMFNEARKKGGTSTFNGYLLLDEMSIQEDLQIVKRGKEWSIVGVVDLGETVNSMTEISREKSNCKLATHCFQFIYVGFNGFRWPVAYFGTDNVNGHSIISRYGLWWTNLVLMDSVFMVPSWMGHLTTASSHDYSFTLTQHDLACTQQLIHSS